MKIVDFRCTIIGGAPILRTQLQHPRPHPHTFAWGWAGARAGRLLLHVDPGRALAPSGLVTDAGIDGFAAAESFKPFLVPCAFTPQHRFPWLGR